MASTNLQSTSRDYRAEMDQAERASRDEIIALQTRRMAWTLAHAYDNVAHYRKAFDKAGVTPQDFRQLSDLSQFPFTAKADLRQNYPFGLCGLSARCAPPAAAPALSCTTPWVMSFSPEASARITAL